MKVGKKSMLRISVKSFLAIVVLIIILFPVIWLFLSSFKTTQEVQRLPIHWLPKKPTLEAFKSVWIDPSGYATHWTRFFLNTIQVTVTTTICVVILGTLIGYGLARFKVWGASYILMFLLVAQLFTGPALMIPIYALLAKIGLYNTLIGLIIAYITFWTPFASWLSYSNFQNIPVELEESATVDGCTPFGAFIRITLPISRTGITTVGLMTFLFTWSEYPFAVVLLESESKTTVAVGLAKFITAFNIYWNQMAAASIIVAIPVLVFLFFSQKFFIQGLTAGALK